MSTEAAAALGELTPFEQLRYARDIVRTEARTLEEVAKRLDVDFCQATQWIYGCPGSVIVTGMGKAGLIGQKIAATLASTGTRSHFLHPAEAVHGDLGRVHQDDVVLALSQSGETEEVVRLLHPLGRCGVAILAITSHKTSTLGRAAKVTLELGPVQEACALGLAPTASTTAMLALGDALALVASRMRGFAPEDFARFHPGGDLGRRLSSVEQHMRARDACRMADESQTVRQVFIELSRPGRRSGAIMVIGSSSELTGLFTDSDLARLFETRRDQALDQPIREVMTKRPCTILSGSTMWQAVTLMAEQKISELPVVDTWGRPVGLIDITDIVGMIPEEGQSDGATLKPREVGSAESTRA